MTQHADLTIRTEGMQARITRPAPGLVTITVTGELDLASVPPLQRHLDRLLCDENRHTALVLDLSRTTFLSAVGLNLIARLKRHRPGRVRLIPGPPHVQRTLRLGGLA